MISKSDGNDDLILLLREEHKKPHTLAQIRGAV